MNKKSLIGIVLIVVGAIALAYQGISYTTEEEVLDVGDVEISKTDEKTLPLPPLIGGAAVAGGLLLLIVGKKG